MMLRSLLVPLLLALVTAAAAEAPIRPIRVLCIAEPAAGEPVREGIARLMEGFGREAIWFDVRGPEALQEAGVGQRYDLVMPAGLPVSQAAGLPVLALPAAEAGLDGVRRAILGAVGSEVQAAWRAFLAQREPERREPHPQVANYEKRPQPVTFQHPLSVRGSLERTQVPADLELRLFAAEPDIRKPIAFAWDERGRCWVCETSDYPHGLVEDGRGHDSIKICEDTDGDGRADKFTVFADRLNIPTGLVFANGGVIVSQPPRFMFLKDTDGDDRADIRQDILTGYGIQDTHAQASNLHYGLDNWLHGCVGYSGFDGLVGGKPVRFTMGTYRFRADGSALQFLHQFTNNAWAHSENAAGDAFGGTANGAPLFYGGIPARALPEGQRGLTAKKINEVDRVHPITPNYRQVDVFHGYTAAAGSAFIESAALPRRLQGMAMVCEPTMKVIALMDVQPQGAGYTARDAFNLVASSDEWMSPVFAEVGPDGAVWFADWQNFIIQHNPTPSVERGGFRGETGVGGAHRNDLRDHSRGRIYRVVARGGDHRVRPPALDGDTQWSRLTAQRLIVEGRAPADGLAARVTANDGAIAALHALWALHGLGRLDPDTHRAALLARDPRLRRSAVRALAADAGGAQLLFGSGVISDPDPHTRLAALVKLLELPTTPEIQTLVRKLGADRTLAADEWLGEAVKQLGRRHRALNYREGPNLLPNPGFEALAADGLPEGWKRRDYGQRPGNAGAEWRSVSGEGRVRGGARSFRVITRDEADTSFFADVPLKPDTDYKLSAWIKTHAFRGKASLNDHLGRAETDQLRRSSDWTLVEVIFNSRNRPKASINLLHVGKGDTYFDDVSLVELLYEREESFEQLAGDPKRGQDLFWKHPVAACMTCHMLGGKGSAVGPALDGIAARKEPAYLLESLINPNARLAEGYTATPISPMPPMNLILKPQELADILAFLGTLH